MPKLTKIRLTGCKYEGLKKEHENSIFDLTRDGQADHTLFTLFNGGGKGVMMQLIFQLLLPETKWGKNHGNKVISMFYDQRNNLNPFTFHVVLEWVLDTVPEKRLITGIGVKAVIKNTSGEDEEKTGISYFLYTHEHQNKSYFSVENLPLFDTTTGKAIDLDKLEAFIDEHKRDFIKYSQSSGKNRDSGYYKYLEERGIYRSEWINLRDINKLEGGAGDYFIGASDNKSIFDKKIIPAISENLKNYTQDEGDHLIEMFKSNLSITKDLPVLIKREGDFKDLLVEIKPLIENADSGSRFMDMQERLVDEGNDIYFILHEEENQVKHNIEKWSNELRKTEEERKDLEFRKDNLQYNKEKNEVEEQEKKAVELQKEYDEMSEKLEEEDKELTLYRINKVLNEKKKTQFDINNKNEERQRLIQALDISDIKERAEELDDDIDIEWNKVKLHWVNQENQYIGYTNYNKKIVEENNIKQKKYEAKEKELQNKINLFKIKEEQLDKYIKKKLEEKYDPMRLAFPVRILEDLNKQKDEDEKKINSLTKEIKDKDEKCRVLEGEIREAEHNLKQKKECEVDLTKKFNKQEKEEKELARRVATQLLESYDASLLNHDWFATKQRHLELQEVDKKQRLEDIQRKIWEKSIDKSLNKENYFIPNKDVLLIKEEIKKLNIHVETGTEYLKGFQPSERANLLSEAPGLLYSVVIGTLRDWEQIEKNINKDLFLNSMVPVYIPSQIKTSENQSFKMVYGKADQLMEEENFVNWKELMEKEMEALTDTEGNLKKDLSNITDLMKDLNFIAKNDTAWILSQNLRKIENEIAELSNVISLKNEEKFVVEAKLKQCKASLETKDGEMKQVIKAIEEMEEYIEKVKELEEEGKLIKETQKDLNNTKVEISIIQDDTENIKEKIDKVKDSFNKWKVEIENTINRVTDVNKEAVYECNADYNYSNYNTPNFSLEADTLLALVKEKKLLNESLAGKNAEIKSIETALEYLEKDLKRHNNELKKLDNNWTQYPDLELNILDIEIKIGEIEKKIKDFKDELEKVKSSLDNITGEIKSNRKQLHQRAELINKAHKKPPIVLEIEDFDAEIVGVESYIELNEKYKNVCYEERNRNINLQAKLNINLTKIKHGYSLDITKGKGDKVLKGKIVDSPDTIVDDWIKRLENVKYKIEETIAEGERFKAKFMNGINKLEEEHLKNKISNTLKEYNISKFKSNLTSFKSMETHFQQELMRLSKDKKKAEEVMKQWTNRASFHVIRMIEALKSMVASMNYINEQGYAFPLVKLKGVEGLPKEDKEISYLLEEYFIQSISKILEKKEDISNISNQALKDIMGDKALFSKAIQGKYPTLLVYKMTEKNEFRYAKAREEYYTTWEAINKGEGDLPEGSGGQTLSVNTFVIMMIMSFKKKHIGNENPSTVLILDNPFGKASAKHILDPIFEIAHKLNFQLICFAAPEIIKVEISERFPVFWELKIKDGKIIHGGRIIK